MPEIPKVLKKDAKLIKDEIYWQGKFEKILYKKKKKKHNRFKLFFLISKNKSNKIMAVAKNIKEVNIKLFNYFHFNISYVFIWEKGKDVLKYS